MTCLAVFGGGWSAGAQSKQVKKVSVTPTKAESGADMFKTYCAACHGPDGKGNGPAASALKVAPPNLTLLKQKNRGKFPALKVTHILEGAEEIHAHGSSDMPLWGPIFHSLDGTNTALTKLRISNVTGYIESIQQ
jgi:mono/diheme cytochrome c family protein